MKIKEVYNFLDFVAPFNTAAQWDNCGLSVGSLDNDFTKIVISLDVTEKVIAKALEIGAQLVVTHHPLIFNPVTLLQSDSLVYKAVQSGITFISTHTCLDKAIGGVNDCLARKAGIVNVQHKTVDEFLKIGDVEPCTVKEFAEKIKDSLGSAVAFTDNGKTIKRVAFCSGGGGDLIGAAAAMGADALLTGEAKHHEYLEAERLGVALITAGHYETEVIACDYLYDLLSKQFDNADVVVFKDKSPVRYV